MKHKDLGDDGSWPIIVLILSGSEEYSCKNEYPEQLSSFPMQMATVTSVSDISISGVEESICN